MDVQQLKLLAGLLRGLLEQHDRPVSHGQSLDLIAALPGLRNWPEVQAFPDRVRATELGPSVLGRLAFRLKSKLQVELEAAELLAALNPPSLKLPAALPELWPTGPLPGVYIAQTQEAINALLAKYEEATDGAPVYAESTGHKWPGTIDLGDDGLWSPGLARVPSGTLLALGPISLSQRAWDDCGSRLYRACIRARASGHRVALLVDSPQPELLHTDLEVALDMFQQRGEQCETWLKGIVTEEGDLVEVHPFASPYPGPQGADVAPKVDAIPEAVRQPLLDAFAKKPFGLLVAGTSEIDENWWAADLVTAALALTEHAGPACRVLPRNRSTPSKDFLVPDALNALPFVASIDSAYAQGYRRMVVSPYSSDVEVLEAYADDVLFICGAYGLSVLEALRHALNNAFWGKGTKLLNHLIAIFTVGTLAAKDKSTKTVSDLYVDGSALAKVEDLYEGAAEGIKAHRLLRWEDQLGELLDTKKVSLAVAKEAFHRKEGFTDWMKSRRQPEEAAAS